MDDKMTIVVVFCDTTRINQEYEPTAWGKMEAQDAWNHYVEMGKENDTIFGRDRTPHVSRVAYLVGSEEQTCEHFSCDCSHVGAAVKEVAVR